VEGGKSTKHQHPENIQTSTSNQREALANEFMFWELGGSLELGALATDKFTVPFPTRRTA
jgi:hypothetical protein